jgi:hypothetical protein
MVQPNGQIVFSYIIDIVKQQIYAAWISVTPLQVSINRVSTIFVKLFNWHGTAEWSDSMMINYGHPLAIYLCSLDVGATTKSERQRSITNLCEAAQLAWYSRMAR